jgi:hypothetical protein
MSKRLGITGIDLKRIQSYMEKAEKAQITNCENCTGEYYDFEGECQLCKKREYEEEEMQYDPE